MNRPPSRNFPAHLKQLCRKSRLTKREIARRAGIDVSAITRIEMGNRNPRPDTLKRLAHALNVPTGDLFAAAGYLTPEELPDLGTYLRVQYGEISDKGVAQAQMYIERLVKEEASMAPRPSAADKNEITKQEIQGWREEDYL
ncbi:hypothetical protein GCM10027059_41800 [Myceligenerans halotolerans]